jgi:hypothetical protein
MKLLIINKKNLSRLCGLNGFKISELAASLGVSDTLLYRAAEFPAEYPGTFKKLEAALKNRTVPSHGVEVLRG